MAASSMTGSLGGTALNLLKGTKGTHPTLRLDAFMKSSDPTYHHSEEKAHGEAFIRKMATYGRTRPSLAFTNESRAHRPFVAECSVGMSNLPPTWNDPRSDPREGTLEYPEAPEVDTTFMKSYENHNLMLPSERHNEHLYMKEAERQWRADRDAIWLHNKRKRMIERHHRQGVVGIDSPMHEGTKLWSGQRQVFEHQTAKTARHAEDRTHHLAYQTAAADAVACRDYGEPIEAYQRSSDIPLQRKGVHPDAHPFRFLDTHNRIFPEEVAMWDAERAKAKRSHDVRHKGFDIISGLDNSIDYPRD
eukprot:gnl/MRDRNA2_/MRDRNA2_105543_c0_seq1.p1 gnl/MRDRNA2_/MRDRNA2_105543_c0~~gnl/MRDRNA2_/MRDRNA2_105543_c0_seq1.p1  ORF type:complete len:304 (+),score=60.43 gnl/MRDRNA2_/MRDRNA2_105543_c0_seq1:133-1044(+)